jgi:hypothetical protein
MEGYEVIKHEELAWCAVKMLPIRLQDLYFEEVEKDEGKLTKRRKDELLKQDCSTSFAWNTSIKGKDFWHSVYCGTWSEEFDREILSEKELTDKVMHILMKISTQT